MCSCPSHLCCSVSKDFNFESFRIHLITVPKFSYVSDQSAVLHLTFPNHQLGLFIDTRKMHIQEENAPTWNSVPVLFFAYWRFSFSFAAYCCLGDFWKTLQNCSSSAVLVKTKECFKAESGFLHAPQVFSCPTSNCARCIFYCYDIVQHG